MSKLRIMLALLALTGCAGGHSLSSTIITPEEFGSVTPFTEAELREPVAVRNLRETPEASFKAVRIKDRLSPRSHANSDAVLMVVSGRVQVLLGKDDFRLTAGNVIELPRGVTYEVVNRDATGSVVYVVYTPQLSEQDVKLVREAPRESSWKWNLFTN
jgi:mannose-6-phosphate isomerase-like protein (cupin superfamily)